MVLRIQQSFLLASHRSLFISDPQFILSFISSLRMLTEKNQSLLSEFSFVFYQKFFPQQALKIKWSACQASDTTFMLIIYEIIIIITVASIFYILSMERTLPNAFLCSSSFSVYPRRGAFHPLCSSINPSSFVTSVLSLSFVCSFKCSLFSSWLFSNLSSQI